MTPLQTTLPPLTATKTYPQGKARCSAVAMAAKKKAPVAKKTTGDESKEVAVMPPRGPCKEQELLDQRDRPLPCRVLWQGRQGLRRCGHYGQWHYQEWLLRCTSCQRRRLAIAVTQRDPQENPWGRVPQQQPLWRCLGRSKDGDAGQEHALQARPFGGRTDGGAPQLL